jgi:hypothetical protein
MWKELQQWEENNNALCYGVICTQDVREHLSGWNCFDEEYKDEYFVCSTEDFIEADIVTAMTEAYNRLEDPCYNEILDEVGNWLADFYRDKTQQLELNLEGGQ